MVKFGVRFEEGSASRHWQSSHVAYGALKKVLKRASQASGRPVGRSNYGPPGRGLLDLEEVADEFKKKKKKLLRVATKYPNLTRRFLYTKGVTQFQLVKSLGSTEVAPFTGTAEIISDITSTGATLKANNLRVLKDGEILKSQACLMMSKLSLRKSGIKKIINLLGK